MGFREPWHWLVLGLIVVVLFGSKRLPDSARALGRSLRIFRSEVKAIGHEEERPQLPGGTGAAPAESVPAAAAPPVATAPPVAAQPVAAQGVPVAPPAATAPHGAPVAPPPDPAGGSPAAGTPAAPPVPPPA